MGNSDATGPLPLMVTFPLSTSGRMEYDLPMKTHSDRVIRFIKINIHQPMSPSTSPIDRDPQSTPTIPNQPRLHCRNFPCALSPPKHTDTQEKLGSILAHLIRSGKNIQFVNSPVLINIKSVAVREEDKGCLIQCPEPDRTENLSLAYIFHFRTHSSSFFE